jgi:DNA polymerase (family 10)
VIGELPRETQAHLRHNVTRAIPLTVARAVLGELRRRLVFRGPSRRRRRYPVDAVGSVRRGAPRSKDLDVLVTVPDETHARGLLASAELKAPLLGGARRGKGAALILAEAYASGKRRRSFIVRRGAKCYAVDLFLATRAERPYALFHFSGDKGYTIRVRAHAKRKGWKLNQYGLYYARRPTVRVRGSAGIRTERQLASFLGVTHRSPAQRHQ